MNYRTEKNYRTGSESVARIRICTVEKYGYLPYLCNLEFPFYNCGTGCIDIPPTRTIWWNGRCLHQLSQRTGAPPFVCIDTLHDCCVLGLPRWIPGEDTPWCAKEGSIIGNEKMMDVQEMLCVLGLDIAESTEQVLIYPWTPQSFWFSSRNWWLNGIYWGWTKVSSWRMVTLFYDVSFG